jgi:hypothetical protein
MDAYKVGDNKASKRRPLILVAAWFGTIALVGTLRYILERQRPG